MAEFASKGVAGSGLGLGIAGTALGGLFGSNNQATISALQAENYSDNDVRRTLFTTKPSVPDVSFDTIVYSEDDKVAKKILNDTLSDLTDAEIATIKLFANASAQEVPSGSISNLLDEHNSI